MRRRFHSPGSVLCPHTVGPPQLFVKSRGSRRSSGDAYNSAPGPEVGEGTGPPGCGECCVVAAISVMGPCGLEQFLSPPLSSPGRWTPATGLPSVVSAGWGGPLREELRRWGTPGSSRELSPGRPRAQEEEGAWGGGRVLCRGQNTASCQAWAQTWPQTLADRAGGRGPERNVAWNTRKAEWPSCPERLSAACPALSGR